MFTKVLLFASFLAISAAYPDGAPESSCFTMHPNHGSQMQTSAPPFLILITRLEAQGGDSITVTIQGRDTYRGFMVQFRNVVSPYAPVGTVVRNDGHGVRPMTCSGGPTTATHINNVPRAIQLVHWIAPVMNGGVTVQ